MVIHGSTTDEKTTIGDEEYDKSHSPSSRDRITHHVPRFDRLDLLELEEALI